jgi:outer membrane protein TolC
MKESGANSSFLRVAAPVKARADLSERGVELTTDRAFTGAATTVLVALMCVAFSFNSKAQEIYPIDLPTALRLAGAQNLDIQIAREKLSEAKANYSGALLQFFPWLSPGAGYRQHDGRIQDVVGNVIDAEKQSYTVGGTLTAQWEIGEAIYRSLAAKQLVRAADHALETQRQESTLAAAQGYFELGLAQATAAVANESVRISQDYQSQVQRAVSAGIAFRGDELRVQVQTERNRLVLRQAEEQQRVASARLAQTLHLDSAVQLKAAENELAPLQLVGTNTALGSLIQQALVQRPELRQNESLIAAAKESRKGAVYGPWIPSLGAQAFVGGLGGGRDGATGDFGRSEDYAVTLGWKIGPGGLLDFSRKRATEARLGMARLARDKIQDEITRQVVEAFARFQSLGGQITVAEQALTAAEASLRLARERKEFAIGIVLETILAEQDLTRVRLDYLRAVSDFNKSQYLLNRAIGKL